MVCICSTYVARNVSENAIWILLILLADVFKSADLNFSIGVSENADVNFTIGFWNSTIG